jgi:hypothetical protein
MIKKAFKLIQLRNKRKQENEDSMKFDILESLEEIKEKLNQVDSILSNILDPDLIESYTYERKAYMVRHDVILRQIKSERASVGES